MATLRIILGRRLDHLVAEVWTGMLLAFAETNRGVLRYAEGALDDSSCAREQSRRCPLQASNGRDTLMSAVVVLATALAFFLRRSRWASHALLASRLAYAALLVQALLYFPSKSGYQIGPVKCQWTFDFALGVHSLQNYPHIMMFALFFLLTYAQLWKVRNAFVWSAVVCITMGLFVELAQGATGAGNCRMRDLIPDAVGVLIGAGIVATVRRVSLKRVAPDAS